MFEKNVQAALTAADHAYVIDQGMTEYKYTAARLVASMEILERCCGV
jgi:ABC-type branched-subunit amino acid transport system ATPase component